MYFGGWTVEGPICQEIDGAMYKFYNLMKILMDIGPRLASHNNIVEKMQQIAKEII